MRAFLGLMAVIMLLVSCGVDQGKYDAQVRKTDSLTKVNAALQTELEGYKYEPAKLLVAIRENYANKDYDSLKKNLDLLHRYHPDAKEYATANSIYEQGQKEQEAARKKAEAERQAKMKPIERIMEKYNCSVEDARLIHEHRVRIGMPAELCRASWGTPRDINRSIGSYGVHEQWCYNGGYLYMEDGILKSIQN